MSCVILQHGGGVSREAHAGSCFGCRKWEFSVLFMALWDDPSPEARAANMAWGNRGWDDVYAAGIATGAYPCDIDPRRRPDGARREVALQFAPDVLERLRALKWGVDPNGLFRASWPLSW